MTDQRDNFNQIKCGELLSLLWLLTGGQLEASVSLKSPTRMGDHSKMLSFKFSAAQRQLRDRLSTLSVTICCFYNSGKGPWEPSKIHKLLESPDLLSSHQGGMFQYTGCDHSTSCLLLRISPCILALWNLNDTRSLLSTKSRHEVRLQVFQQVLWWPKRLKNSLVYHVDSGRERHTPPGNLARSRCGAQMV